jgi:lysophospholipase L1-like esterase
MFKNLLLVIVSILLTTLFFVGSYELVAGWQYDRWRAAFETNGDWFGRLTRPSDNPVLMWEYHPDSAGEKWDTAIETNEYGFRDRSHTLQKPVGTTRILFGGDSITLGIGVEGEQIFARRFDRAGQTLQPPVEAIAMAVDGYSATQVLELLRTRAPEFQPDMVVYVMCLNDFDFEESSGRKIRYFKKPDSFFLEELETLYIRFSGINYYQYHFEKNKQAVFAEIEQTSGWHRDEGIEFKVLIMPILHGDKTTSPDYIWTEMYEEIIDTLTNKSIATLDMRDSFNSSGNSLRSYARDELHLNGAGHKFVADELVRQLITF